MLWESSPENSNTGDNYFVQSQEADSDKSDKSIIQKNNEKPPHNNFSASFLTRVNTKSLHDTVPDQIKTSESYNHFVFTQSQKEPESNMEVHTKKNKMLKKRLSDIELEEAQEKKKKKKNMTPENKTKQEKSATKKQKSKEKKVKECYGDILVTKKKKKKKKNNKERTENHQVLRKASSCSSIDSIQDPVTNELFSQFRENQTGNSLCFDNMSKSSLSSALSIDTIKLSQMRSYLDVMEPVNEESTKSGMSSMDINKLAEDSEVLIGALASHTTTLTKSGLMKNSIAPVKSKVSLKLKKNNPSTSYKEEKDSKHDTDNNVHNISKDTIQNNEDGGKKKKKHKKKKSKDSTLIDAENVVEKFSSKSGNKEENLKKNSKHLKIKEENMMNKSNNILNPKKQSSKKSPISAAVVDTTSDSDESDTHHKKTHTMKEKIMDLDVTNGKLKTPKKRMSKSLIKTTSSSMKVKTHAKSPAKAVYDMKVVNDFVTSMISARLMSKTDEENQDSTSEQTAFVPPAKSKGKKKTEKRPKKVNGSILENTLEHENLYREFSAEDLELLRYLSVQVDFEVPELHKIERGVMRFPMQNQIDEIEALGVEVKKGTYTPEESEHIINNWKRFCKIHDFPEKPELFMNLNLRDPNKKLVLQKEESLNFVKFLAHGLPNRLLYSVHRRFRVIYSNVTRGLFTPEENELIVDTVEKTKNCHNIFVRLGKELNRNALCIEKHYIWLRENTIHEYKKHRISHDEGGMIVKRLMEEMDLDDVFMLKNLHIPYSVYVKIGEEFQFRPLKIQAYWLGTLYPKLFVSGSRELWGLKMKLIDMTLANPEFKTLSHLNFHYFLEDDELDGWTHSAIGKLMRNMLHGPPFDYYRNENQFKEALLRIRADICQRRARYLESATYVDGVLYMDSP